ncbi:site-specific integrase [Agathobaculum sp. TL06]
MAQVKKTRSAAGNGTIRKRKDGTWEGRYTTGTDPKTGRQIRRSIYGKTQKEVRERLRQITTDVDTGAYVAPCAMKFSEWLDIWLEEYLTGRSPLTVSSYESYARNHIKPALGAIRLDHITPVHIQKFINALAKTALSPKTVKNIHGIIHRCLQQAVLIGYLRDNPADVCNLPKIPRSHIQPLSDEQIAAMIHQLQSYPYPYATLYFVTLFTGMRQGEVLGLGWEDVDFRSGTILVHRQLRRLKERGAGYDYAEPKDHASRVIKPAPSVMTLLKRHRIHQSELQLAAGSAWSNPMNLVFTNELGGHLTHITVYRHFKQIIAELGFPDFRFHDLRHTYAVVSLENGDDIKTVQENLGHATAAFTLDVYGHVTDRMRKESSDRMEKFIHQVSTL